VNKHISCLQCNSKSLKPLTRYSKAYLVQCNQCSFIFSEKIPTTSELIAHYNTYHRDDSISSITLKRYEELTSNMNYFKKNNTWLDVGCGNGHLLSVSKKNGWDAYGVEFTETAVAISRAKGITVFKGELDIKDYTENKFDVITFIEVLEHINNPNQELSAFNYLLRKGGALYITIPNFNSLSRFLFKEKWNIIEYPEHLCYYTRKSLHNALIKNGFEKISLVTTGFSMSRLEMSIKSNVVSNTVNFKDEHLRDLTENKLWARLSKRIVNKILKITSSGDTIKALYIKK